MMSELQSKLSGVKTNKVGMLWIYLLAISCTSCQQDSTDNNYEVPSTKLHQVIGCDNPDRRLDVVFLHGVDGHHLTTWHPPGEENDYWPRWIGEDIEDVGVWAMNYPAATSPWGGDTMALIDRARNVLSHMETEDFGEKEALNRPIVFVCHSFGGLVVKQMLEIGQESPTKEWNRIFHRTNGVVFIATPNNGAMLAQYIDYVLNALKDATKLGSLPIGNLTSVTVDELKHASPHLLKLNRWYRNTAPDNGIDTFAFCEKKNTYGIRVVDETTADPAIKGVDVRPLGENHLSICKPQDRDKPVYKLTLRFLKKCLSPTPPCNLPDPINSSIQDGRCPNPPTPEEVAERASQLDSVSPEEVTLHYENRTNRKLRIALYDWSRAYDGWNSVWRFLDAPPGVGERYYEDFVTERENGNSQNPVISSGWFSVYVVMPNCEMSRCLLTAKFFGSKDPILRIEKRADGLIATLENQ